MSRNLVLKESIAAISDDTKFIRLATITTFIHSLLFILYLIYLLATIWTTLWSDSTLGELLSDYVNIVAPSGEAITVLIIIGIFLAIGYSILPPIWEAAMIYYVDSERKSGSTSLGKGTNRFFPMFEFDATMTFFSIMTRAIAVSRLFIMDAINPITIIFLGIWLTISLLAMILLPYTKFIITLENKKYFEAIKGSMSLAIRHLWVTLKYVMINLFLYLRFILNIIIVVWIPLVLLRLASRLDFADSRVFQIIVIIIAIWLVLLTAYINGIIEAFFTSYRWRVYKQITSREEAESLVAND